MAASTATRSSSIRRQAVSPPPAISTTSSAPVGNGIIAKGPSARSAMPSRLPTGPLSPQQRRARQSLGQAAEFNAILDVVSDDPYRNESRESLLASLKRETQEKEELSTRHQLLTEELTTIRKESDNLLAALNFAEQRVQEQEANQLRMEQETESKVDIIEKLRAQIRELEKDKRDALRRYNEQAQTFEAERQSHYDTEQHLRSRIQSLSQARKRSPPRSRAPPKSPSIAPQESEDEAEPLSPSGVEADSEKNDNKDASVDEYSEPAEMTALRLELQTLSVSHASTQVTLQHLQNELADLKRVNLELQEENESYNILLREKTLTGHFDLLRGSTNSDDDEQATEGGLSFAEEREREGRAPSIRSRATLDVVPEGEEHPQSATEPSSATRPRSRRTLSPARSKRSQRGRNSSPSSQDSPVGDNLGDLPISGPGLDLAAELGRAENRSISAGDTAAPNGLPQDHKPAAPSKETEEIRNLRQEIKSLKDANKALSLYASKILDRIIAQEGFENILAVDYEAKPKPKQEAQKSAPATVPPPVESAPKPKPRPKSSFFPPRAETIAHSTSPPAPLSRTESESSSVTAASSASMVKTNSAPSSVPATAADKRARRGLSMDWKNPFGGLFGGAQPPPEPEPKNDKLRPLTLRASIIATSPSATATFHHQPNPPSNIPGARKLAHQEEEDEEDRIERERLKATLKLMGIEKPDHGPLRSPTAPPSKSNPVTPPIGTDALPATSTRVPFFTRFSRSPESLPHSPAATTTFAQQQSHRQQNLTAEALEQAEAESALAHLDAQEKLASAEYAKGGGPTFTEISSMRGGSLSESFLRRNRSNKSRSQNGGSGGRPSYDAEAGDGSVMSHHSRSGSVNTIFSAGAMSVDIEHLGGPTANPGPGRNGVAPEQPRTN